MLPNGFKKFLIPTGTKFDFIQTLEPLSDDGSGFLKFSLDFSG